LLDQAPGSLGIPISLLFSEESASVRLDDPSSRRRKPTQSAHQSTVPQRFTKLKRLTLDLPEPLHRAIKREAVEQGVTMAQMLRALLLKHYRLPAEGEIA
jgi:predicted DNA binding CopG/RHH family protein